MTAARRTTSRRPRPDPASARRRSPGASAPTSWASSTSRRTRSPATGSSRTPIPWSAPWRPRAGWSPRAPTCSTSAASRPGPDTRPSTRPRRSRRVVPVIAAVAAALPDTPISVDTTKPAVAEAALAAGADLLNDVWGTGPDVGAMAAVAAGAGVPLIVMHNRAEARYERRRRRRGRRRPAAPPSTGRSPRACRRTTSSSIPGIGFGKTADHNLAVLRHLGALSTLGRPVLLGTSRKSTLGRILDLPVEERLEATLATTALGIAAGVDIVRVHDVARQRPRRPGQRRHRARALAHDARRHADGEARDERPHRPAEHAVPGRHGYYEHELEPPPSRSRSTSSSC